MATPIDLVVVLPGILGSTLSRDGELVWAASAGSVKRAVESLGKSLQRLQLPSDIGDEHPGDGVEPVALMPDLHVVPGIWTPVKGYDRLVERLQAMGYREPSGDWAGNLIQAPYDWRLSNRHNGERLKGIVEPALGRWQARGGPFAEAKVSFVCHSMGGLVARWYIEHCGGAEITRKLITIGTPYRGAAKALEQLVNGVHKGIGALGLDLTDFVRSLPSMYQLLPEYACVEQGLDLVKTTEIELPGLDRNLVADAMLFHTELAGAERARPANLGATHAIVGIHQPTATTARIVDDRVEMVNTYRAQDLQGDSTVPVVAALRPDLPMDSPLLRRIADQHGNLQRNHAALDEVVGILAAQRIDVRGPDRSDLSVDAPDLLIAGEDLHILVSTVDGSRKPVRITVTDEAGRIVDARLPAAGDTTTIQGLAPGAYGIDVTGLTPGTVAPVSRDLLVW